MLKKIIDDPLLLADEFLVFFQTVRLALHVDGGALMQNTIQNGRSDGDISKDLVPLEEGLVKDKDSGGLLMPPSNKLKEQVCALDVHRKAVSLLDNKHPVLNQSLEFVGQTILKGSSNCSL